MLPEKANGGTAYLPIMPISLQFKGKTIATNALLDSGSTVNVLPYSVGITLGLDWESQQVPVPLTGNLKSVEAFGVVVAGIVEDCAPTNLAFAWAKTDQIPMILGQNNFFQAFNICFFRGQLVFDVSER